MHYSKQQALCCFTVNTINHNATYVEYYFKLMIYQSMSDKICV